MLLATKSFSVWGTTDEVVQSQNQEKKSAILVGGKKLTTDEIYKITSQNVSISLDSNSKQDVDTNAATIRTKTIYSGSSELSQRIRSSNVFLPVEFSKAAILFAINSLMQGKSGLRSEVIEFLTEILNSGFVPLFSSVETAQAELVLTILGEYPSCYSPHGPFSSSQALQSARLAPVALYDHEAITLLNGDFTYPGFAAYLVLGASKTFKSLDVISSFSCECVGVPTSSFDAENFDVLRPHRGQMNSASNVRLMLESSGNVNTASSSDDLTSFLQIPQVNGPASDLINQAMKYDHLPPSSFPLLTSPLL
jgi:histidine ammonia-lyase